VALDDELYALAMAACTAAGAQDRALDLYSDMLAEVSERQCAVYSAVVRVILLLCSAMLLWCSV
jgi:hypothetical protein